MRLGFVDYHDKLFVKLPIHVDLPGEIDNRGYPARDGIEREWPSLSIQQDIRDTYAQAAKFQRRRQHYAKYCLEPLEHAYRIFVRVHGLVAVTERRQRDESALDAKRGRLSFLTDIEARFQFVQERIENLLLRVELRGNLINALKHVGRPVGGNVYAVNGNLIPNINGKNLGYVLGNVQRRQFATPVGESANLTFRWWSRVFSYGVCPRVALVIPPESRPVATDALLILARGAYVLKIPTPMPIQQMKNSSLTASVCSGKDR